MPQRKRNNESKLKKLEFHSFLEWKEAFFSDLIKEDKFNRLRADSEQLAITLANDTFNTVQRKKK